MHRISEDHFKTVKPVKPVKPVVELFSHSNVDKNRKSIHLKRKNEDRDPLNFYETETIKCSFCEKTFLLPEDFKLHMDAFHNTEHVKQLKKNKVEIEYKVNSKNLQCKICKNRPSFKLDDHLDYHMKTMHPKHWKPKDITKPISSKGYKCLNCAKEFSTPYSLVYHMKSVHKDGNITGKYSIFSNLEARGQKGVVTETHYENLNPANLDYRPQKNLSLSRIKR